MLVSIHGAPSRTETHNARARGLVFAKRRSLYRCLPAHYICTRTRYYDTPRPLGRRRYAERDRRGNYRGLLLVFRVFRDARGRASAAHRHVGNTSRVRRPARLSLFQFDRLITNTRAGGKGDVSTERRYSRNAFERGSRREERSDYGRAMA